MCEHFFFSINFKIHVTRWLVGQKRRLRRGKKLVVVGAKYTPVLAKVTKFSNRFSWTRVKKNLNEKKKSCKGDLDVPTPASKEKFFSTRNENFFLVSVLRRLSSVALAFRKFFGKIVRKFFFVWCELLKISEKNLTKI